MQFVKYVTKVKIFRGLTAGLTHGLENAINDFINRDGIFMRDIKITDNTVMIIYQERVEIDDAGLEKEAQGT